MNAASEHVLARLHMNAVFPCLAALVRLDDAARALISGQSFAVQLKTRSGLRSRLVLFDGEMRIGGEQIGKRDLELLFLSDRQLNNSFSGSGFYLPLPVRGIYGLARKRSFSRLAARLRRVLKASPLELLDEKLLAVHTDLLIGDLIPCAIVELARFDEPCRRWLAPYGGMTVGLKIRGGASCCVRLSDDEALHRAADLRKLPDVLITFRDRHVALAAFRGELDSMAAIGKGEVTVRGMIPLADALDRVLARLSRLMSINR